MEDYIRDSQLILSAVFQQQLCTLAGMSSSRHRPCKTNGFSSIRLWPIWLVESLPRLSLAYCSCLSMSLKKEDKSSQLLEHTSTLAILTQSERLKQQKESEVCIELMQPQCFHSAHFPHFTSCFTRHLKGRLLIMIPVNTWLKLSKIVKKAKLTLASKTFRLRRV